MPCARRPAGCPPRAPTLPARCALTILPPASPKQQERPAHCRQRVPRARARVFSVGACGNGLPIDRLQACGAGRGWPAPGRGDMLQFTRSSCCALLLLLLLALLPGTSGEQPRCPPLRRCPRLAAGTVAPAPQVPQAQHSPIPLVRVGGRGVGIRNASDAHAKPGEQPTAALTFVVAHTTSHNQQQTAPQLQVACHREGRGQHCVRARVAPAA